MTSLKTEPQLSKRIIIAFRIFASFILVLAILGLTIVLLDEFEIGSSFLDVVYIFGAEKTALSLILLIMTSILLLVKETSFKIKVVLTIIFILLIVSTALASCSLFYSIVLAKITDGWGVILIILEFQMLNVLINYILFFSILGIFFVLFILNNRRNKYNLLILPISLSYSIYELVLYGFSFDAPWILNWIGSSSFDYYLAISFLFFLGVSFIIQSFIGRSKKSEKLPNKEQNLKLALT